MRKVIISVIGPGETATNQDLEQAYMIGQLIAQEGWVLLTGGRRAGVMEAASCGAKSQGGLTIGILPDRHSQGVSEFVDLAIFTDLGNGRNNLNVLSCEVAIACGLGLGTVSEIALALKNDKPVIFLGQSLNAQELFGQLSPEKFLTATNPQEAINLVKKLLQRKT